ncbi:MAG: hypothetical protein KC492_25870, partial [Myxococcales bacterium]|nr:hypothetical protein [Myxococcales bacterium]
MTGYPTPEALWEAVHSCFDTDDGSLPAILLMNLADTELAAVYAQLRKRSEVVSEEASFWDAEQQCLRPLDDVPNAAELVAAGAAEAFHVVLRVIDGVVLPDLGVHFATGRVTFDYRMGAAWGPSEVWAFFTLLKELLGVTAGRLELDDECPPNAEEFIAAWQRFARVGGRPAHRMVLEYCSLQERLVRAFLEQKRPRDLETFRDVEQQGTILIEGVPCEYRRHGVGVAFHLGDDTIDAHRSMATAPNGI